ncbi:urea amidolyase, partial [Cellulomonas bogoriensis 69B4 = DSM 16987]
SAVVRALASVEPAPVAAAGAGDVVLDTVYDGPDLHRAATALGTGVDGLVTAHTTQVWTSAFLGFAPGFAYLRAAAPSVLAWDVPRRATPRTTVPSGSVALAGPFSAVYPRVSPGGWQLVGRTEGTLWDLDQEPPARLVPGTRVRFRAVRATALVTSGPVRPVTGQATGPGGTGEDGPDAARGLQVLGTGPQVLVQDLGRPGHLRVGVPRSGALDRGAAVAGNRAVGNPRGAAVLEVVLGGAQVRAAGHQVLALTGAVVPVRVVDAEGGERVAPAHGSAFGLADGHVLLMGAPTHGLRTYLAVRGGIDTPVTLGSRSTDVLSGLGPQQVRAGDLLPVGAAPGDAVPAPERSDVAVQGPAARGRAVRVRLVPGPQEGWFAPGSRERLHGEWVVGARADRVGLRLEGPPLERVVHEELPSAGLVPGAVQVPPDGQPVVFLADHPVTGGYPVVGAVVADDLTALAQVRPGDVIRLVPEG